MTEIRYYIKKEDLVGMCVTDTGLEICSNLFSLNSILIFSPTQTMSFDVSSLMNNNNNDLLQTLCPQRTEKKTYILVFILF